MERIRQAVERARGPGVSNGQAQQYTQQSPVGMPAATSSARREPVLLNGRHLESMRIISHDIADPRSKSFDMLRTQVLQSMDANSWRFLGVTSPTAECGKSIVATNLALSIARQPEKSVLLIDMDLQKAQVAKQLGLRCDQGLIGVLRGKTDLSRAIVPVGIKNSKLLVLPCETTVPNSSEWMASRSMTALLKQLNRDFKNWTIILDLPPILLTDDVISILPQIDCVPFVAAAGLTTAPEIKECNKHLEATPVVRIVLNKATETSATYYYGYSRYGSSPAPQAKANGRGSARPAGVGRSIPSSLRKLVDRLTRF